MPRIAADTVAEHVQQQESAVVRAAAQLFAERGVNDVSLGDIAAQVGLARNSLYRYFPDKAHIFAAWFRAELEPLQERSEAIAGAGGPPSERLDRWLMLHLDYLVAPEHQAMMAAVTESASLAEVVRDQVGEGHRDLYATLATIVDELGPGEGAFAPRDVRVVTMLIAGLLRSAADLVIGGADHDTVAAELRRVARSAAG
jgi:AcrR family transcriptional regulator